MDLSLTAEEREFVMSILEERQRELLREISRTHSHEFRVILQKNEGTLESVLTKLRVADLPHA